MSTSRSRIIVGGASLVAATMLFAAVFSYLAAAFDYPTVLARPAGDVLPALLALGRSGRIVWLVIPLLLVPTAIGVNEAARATAPRLGRAILWLATLSALAMMTGLLRWPTLHWTLAREWASASPAARDVLASRFGTANLYLGNVVGEFVGELFLNGFFLASSTALSTGQPRRRWLAFSGVAASALGWIAMLRNLTPLVAAVHGEFQNSRAFLARVAILVGSGGARSGRRVSASAGDRCPTRWSRRCPLGGGRIRARQAPAADPQPFSKTVAQSPSL